MNAFVQYLAERHHPVRIGGPKPSLAEFKKRIEEIGYVFIKFTETKGGTDLGFRVDKASTKLNNADFVQGSGSVHVEGELTLNYVKVRCIADIDLATLDGTGKLVILQEVNA